MLFQVESSEKAREVLNFWPIMTLLCLNGFCMQYWKPGFWWESPGAKLYRHLIGDRGVDIIMYTVLVFLLVCFIDACHSAKQRLDNEQL